MKVKRIYMDLKEATPGVKQWRDVWVLESEAFKDPITIDIEFDSKDVNYLEWIKQSIELQLNEAKRVLALAQNTELEIRTLKEEYRIAMDQAKKEIEDSNKKTEKAIKEKDKVLKEVKELREAYDKLNEQVKALQYKYIDLEQKTSKEPRVFSGQSFVSWNWISALTWLKVPNGNYIVSEVLRIVEKNEYVENEDMEVHAYNLHVSDNLFVPEYNLVGTTALDTPTATIDRTFTLLPY